MPEDCTRRTAHKGFGLSTVQLILPQGHSTRLHAVTWKLACGAPRLAQREPRPTAKPVASSTSSRNRSRTGCVNPGIVSVAAAASRPAPCDRHAVWQLLPPVLLLLLTDDYQDEQRRFAQQHVSHTKSAVLLL